MQLRSLEIQGFKSFADKTKFLFDQGITGVVGPNGCGKSNIVDAIRWVLGEQKIRALRSEKMENIIFNGSDDRKKSGFAQVSLTFDNTRNILPTEYGQVTISRKYFRNGDSEYFLNNVPCRLKDISNLLLDTGIGPDSYAIIELKMVEEILNDKDNSRRILFEEAAGISKYKIRKRQTLKKMKETQDDLERVEDLLFEIDKNLKTLENQANKAKKYRELKEKYKLLSSQYAWFRIQILKEKFEAIQNEERAFDDRISGIQAEIVKLESEAEELRRQQVDNEKVLASRQQELNDHVSNIRKIETEKSIKNERLKFLQQRELSINEQHDTERYQRDKTGGELSEVRAIIEKGNADYIEKEKELRRQFEILNELSVSNEGLKTSADEAFRKHREIEQELHRLQKEKEIMQIQIQSYRNEIGRHTEDNEDRSTELNAFAGSLRKLVEELQAIGREVLDLREQKEKNETDIRDAEVVITELKDKVYKINRSLDSRQNEYSLTKSLVESLEGFPESVKFLKKEAAWMKDAPLLSDVFNVGENYKVAFENLLEPYLNYYVVPSWTDALAAIKLLADSDKGRANFFILDELENYQARQRLNPDHAEHALTVVEFGPAYRNLASYLLDRVYIMDDEANFPTDLPDDLVFINRLGNISRRKFRLGGGSIGMFQGKRLGRAKNLEKLEVEIKELEKELLLQKNDLDRAEKNLAGLKFRRAGMNWDARNEDLQQKKRDHSVLLAREQEYQEFIRKAGERTDVIAAQVELLEKDVEEISPKIQSLSAEFDATRSDLEEKRRLLESSDEKLSEVRSVYTDTNIDVVQTRNTRDNLFKDEDRMQQQIDQLEQSERKLLEDLEITRNDIHELIEKNLRNDTEIVALYDERRMKEAAVEHFEQVAAGIRNDIGTTEDNTRKKRREKDELEDEKNAIREKVTELRLDLNSVKERMQVEFDVDITQLDKEKLFDQPMDQYSEEMLSEKMFKLRNRLQNYGEINPMAVEAYDEMKKRFDLIDGQKKDLLDARQNLLDTIAEIDLTATAKFHEAFTKIRENFVRVFQSLFSEGDTCDLLLMDPNDPLESGIDIIARPKGKRPLTINQLSGGEKTLTAISLLFAIYLLKPAPFCVFDEVDAPLDDANIDKFNNIVRDFSSESQFIIVTHNKRTMVATNVMYGVTMEETGVSKVLPVDLVGLGLN